MSTTTASSPNVYHNVVGAAIAGSFVCIYAATTSLWKTSQNKEKYDVYYRRMMLINSYLMAYVFLALLISNFISELNDYADKTQTNRLGVYVWELPRWDIFILVITLELFGIIHHTINIIRIQYEMFRNKLLFHQWLLCALILTMAYSIMIIWIPLMPFLVIFFNVDTIPHIIQIVLYCKLMYVVKKRSNDCNDDHETVAVELEPINAAKSQNRGDEEDERTTEIAPTEQAAEEQQETKHDDTVNDKNQTDIIPTFASSPSEHDSTTFCCHCHEKQCHPYRVYPGYYASNNELISRYCWCIIASLLHQFSGFVMLGVRVLITDNNNPIIKYNLDLITGYGLIYGSIKAWEKVIVLTPAAFAMKLKQ